MRINLIGLQIYEFCMNKNVKLKRYLQNQLPVKGENSS